MQTAILTNQFNCELSENFAKGRGDDIIHYTSKFFPDGEIDIILDNCVEKITIIHRILPPFMDNHNSFYELLSIANKAKKAGAKYIEVILPYIFYSRDDNLNNPMLELNFRLMKESGIDEVCTLDFHNPKMLNNQAIKVKNHYSMQIFQRYLSTQKNQVVISPDEGSFERAKLYSDYLSAPLLICKKNRSLDMIVIELPKTQIDLEGKDCIIVDDLIGTGQTLKECSILLKEKNVRSIKAFATHLVMPDLEKTNNNLRLFDKIYISDSIKYEALPDNTSVCKIISF